MNTYTARVQVLTRFQSHLNYKTSLRNEDDISKLICEQHNLMFVVWLPYISCNFTALCILKFKIKFSLLQRRSLKEINV
jgi:hypothetical protein